MKSNPQLGALHIKLQQKIQNRIQILRFLLCFAIIKKSLADKKTTLFFGEVQKYGEGEYSARGDSTIPIQFFMLANLVVYFSPLASASCPELIHKKFNTMQIHTLLLLHQ